MWQSAGKYVPRVDQLVKVAPAIIEMGCFARVETNGGAAFREILRRQSVPLLQLFRRFGEEGNRKDGAGIYPEQNHQIGRASCRERV